MNRVNRFNKMNGYALSFIQISKSHVRLKPEVEKD